MDEPLYVELLGEAEVDELARHITDPDREQPVVGLTGRPREHEPALDPQDVREVVGDHQEIVFVPDGPLTRRLEACLPPKLHVFGGAARIWWPGVTETSDPRDHPLIQDRHGVYGSRASALFRQRWEEGPPHRPERLLESPELALLRDEVRLRPARTAPLDAPTSEPSDDGLDGAGRIAVAITRAWCEALDAPSREEWPLRPFVVGRSFPDSLAALAPASDERAAYVCAMVICGLAAQLNGLQVHHLRAGGAGDAPQLVRERDGARAWRCALRTNTPSAPRLHYWQRPDGVVELSKVGVHDHVDIV